MAHLKVREDWLRKHGQDYLYWSLLMELFIASNAYAVVPASHGMKSGNVQDSDILVYEAKIKGPPAAFSNNGYGTITCVNYPGLCKPMTHMQFVDFVNNIMKNGLAADKQLVHILSQV